MASKIESLDLDNLIRRYLAGEGVAKLGHEAKVAPTTLREAFAARGVALRTPSEDLRLRWARFEPGKRRQIFSKGSATRKAEFALDDQAVVSAYMSGLSAIAVGKQFKCDPQTVRNRVEAAGERLRSASEQERIKWTGLKQSRAAVRRQLSAAWRASTGRVRGIAEKVQTARTCCARRSRSGLDEDALAARLGALGLTCIQQFDDGPYNIDLAICASRIAVEIERPQLYGPLRPHKAKRTKYLLDRGWCVLFVLRDVKHGLDVDGVANCILAYAQEPGWLEASIGKYGVIGRQAQLVATSGFEFDQLPRVEGPQGSKDSPFNNG